MLGDKSGGYRLKCRPEFPCWDHIWQHDSAQRLRGETGEQRLTAKEEASETGWKRKVEEKLKRPDTGKRGEAERAQADRLSHEHRGCTIGSGLILDYWKDRRFAFEQRADLHWLIQLLCVCVCRHRGRNVKHALENKQGPPFQPVRE